MNTKILDQINKKIDEIKTNRDHINQLMTYKSRAGMLQKLKGRAENAYISLRTLKENGIPLVDDLAFLKERSKKIIGLVEGLRKEIQEDPTSLSQPKFLVPLEAVIETLEKEATQTSSSSWAQEVDRHLSGINGQFIEMMKKMAPFATEAERLSLERKSLSEEKNRTPTSLQKISIFKERAKELKERYRTLIGRIGTNPEVREFLSESSRENGASISLLTQPVMEWIKENGLEGHFRIVGGNR